MTMEGNVQGAGARIAVMHPDVVLPSQYFAPQRNQAPEQRLMIAVLHDALDCLDKYRFATDTHDRRLFHEAMEWFLADDIEWPYSFECICSVLGLDATAVRQRLCIEPVSQSKIQRSMAAETLLWRSRDNGWDEV